MKISESEIMLRRAWITQLYKEHKNICWNYKVDLSKPIIEIFNNQKNLGQWISKFKTIKIDLTLIQDYSWDVVINILKHEMAHQIVHEIFNCDDKHGEVFIKACSMIGVPEEFRSASGDIHYSVKKIVEKRFDSDNAKMLEKVRKLLSLAKSPNENEAFLAMKKAHELIEKHNIKQIEQNDGSRYVYEIITHKKKRIESSQRRICSILLDFYFVDIVYSYLFDPVSCQTYKTIEILGSPENVKIAQHVYF
ncbi:SprT-like domain-containing protein, partial [Candidatus Latescibacterota bacterium]